MKTKDQNGFAHIVLVLVMLVVIACICIAGWLVYNRSVIAKESKETPPQFVTANFIDSSKIYSISKFRSLMGHDFSGGGETCRSMKHYFIPQITSSDKTYQMQHNGTVPAPDGKTDISIHSPFDGKVKKIQSEHSGKGEQLYLVPDSAPHYTVRLFHIYKADGIRSGSKITAGQKIGVIGRAQTMDVAVEIGDTYYSVFSVMTDAVFAQYIARGAEDRNKLIISREYRDAHPVVCNQDKNSNQEFTKPANYNFNDDEFHLKGYISADLES